ncbi:hypothetical protein B4153_3224 [Bacillus cereus]|nr:hypothetical protein B4153_3224 [Bacillus cereus]
MTPSSERYIDTIIFPILFSFSFKLRFLHIGKTIINSPARENLPF